MSKLIMLCGIPGSGKSTFAKKVVETTTDTVWVSRDKIRFSLVAENEPYFSKEDEVINQFHAVISEALNEDLIVIADATHLNEKSRVALLEGLSVMPDSIDAVWFDVGTEQALERNNNRAGTRSFVPREVIRRMANQFRKPKFKEGRFTINRIIRVDDDGNIQEILT